MYKSVSCNFNNMLHLTQPVITIFLLYLTILCECMPKNVCKQFEDYRTIQNNPNCWYNPDVGASPSEIVKRYGFPFESYEVTTQDGYIVSLFRIPHNGSDINLKRPVVFFQHGFAVDGITWMAIGLKSSVFLFSNNGYDVWISNSRGTQYSSKHIKYTVHDPQYWNFSFHELALYDVTAMIDFIVQKTEQAGYITYIGHSMGSTMSLVYASLMPQHATKNLKSIVTLAPVAYMDNIRTVVRTLVPHRYLIWNLLTSIGLYGIGPNLPLKVDLFQRLCTTYPFISLCDYIFISSNGHNKDEDTPSVFPVAFRRYASGISLKTILHYLQIMAEKRRFQFFDYGSVLNWKFYNSSVPPEYPLSKINIPVHLFYGKNDLLSTEKDVLYLYDKLKTKKTIMEVFNFGHVNFIAAVHAPDFYQLLLKYL